MDRLGVVYRHFQETDTNKAGNMAGGKVKVALLGASGGIGQPLAMLLKLDPLVGELRLYDIVNTPGVGADLSHVDTGAKVTAFVGKEAVGEAVKGAELVVIPAGVPRKPGMTRDDLFNINAGIVQTLVEACAENCPNAWLGIISNPVNSTVPIAAEVLKAKGTYNKKKVLGVTTLDLVRANTFWAEYAGVQPAEAKVPVIGGHAGITILPLLSQAEPKKEIEGEKLQALSKRIQEAGTEVVEAKAGAGSATLSMAYAAARFAHSCMRAMLGEKDVVECAYVESDVEGDLPFFASPLRLGREGVEEYLPLGTLSEYEKDSLLNMKPELSKQIQKGVDFATSKK